MKVPWYIKGWWICAFLMIAIGICGVIGCTHTQQTATQNTDGTVSITTQVVQGMDPAIKQASIDALTVATELGADNGLKLWYKKMPDASIAAAQGLSVNIKTQIIPWLKGGTFVPGPDIMQLLQSKLTNGIDLDLISLAGLITIPIDLAVNAPSANLLYQDKIDFIVGGLTGIAKGCDDFVANPKAAPKTRESIKAARGR
jgi:hypothetical protein